MSAREAKMAKGLLPGGTDVPFAEIEVTLARLVRDAAAASAGPPGPPPPR